MDEGGQVTTIVENEVQLLAILEGNQLLLQTPVELLLGLALPGKDRNTGSGNGGGGEPSSRVVSPMPTTPITPLGNGSDGDGDGLSPPPVARGDAAATPAAAAAADGQRPPLETFVTAQEDLPRAG